VKKIVIYVEGGGDSTTQQAALREGFDELFRKKNKLQEAKG